MDHNDRDIELSMGALGRVSDGRYIIAVIQTLRTAMRALDSGKLADLSVLVEPSNGVTNTDGAKYHILRNALLYSGLQATGRDTYRLAEYLYGLLLESGAAPTVKASDGVAELDLAALAKANTNEAKHVVREALFSLGDVIKFDANFFRMA